MKNPFKTFRLWEHKFALTFVSLVVTLALWGYDHYREQNPRLKVEVLSRANVIDVKEQVSDLDVIYKGASLRSNGQTLAVITLRISNDGAAPIPISAYDPTAPIGLSISTKNASPERDPTKIAASFVSTLNKEAGSIIAKLPFDLFGNPAITKVEIISASREYLFKSVNPTHTATNATFSPVIFKAGDWFELKLLVLHGEGKDFDIKPIGEVADVKEIIFEGVNSKRAPKSFWTQVLGGDLWIQIIRIPIYLGAVVLLFFSLIKVVEGFDQYRGIRNRRVFVQHFKARCNKAAFGEYSWVLDEFVDSPGIARTLSIYIKSPEMAFHRLEGSNRDEADYVLAKTLVQLGLINGNWNEAKMDPKFMAFAKDFTNVVNRRKGSSYDGVWSEVMDKLKEESPKIHSLLSRALINYGNNELKIEFPPEYATSGAKLRELRADKVISRIMRKLNHPGLKSYKIEQWDGSVEYFAEFDNAAKSKEGPPGPSTDVGK